MGSRLDFQSLLEDLQDGVNVYYQPPTGLAISYPAIVYNQDFRKTEHADNIVYVGTWRYLVQVITHDPDDSLITLVANLPMTTFLRHFAHDNLNHNVFNVYF